MTARHASGKSENATCLCTFCLTRCLRCALICSSLCSMASCLACSAASSSLSALASSSAACSASAWDLLELMKSPPCSWRHNTLLQHAGPLCKRPA